MATPEPDSALVLLPPSEGKATGGGRPAWSPDRGAFGPTLGAARAEVVAALGAVDGGDQRLLGVRGDHLERSRQSNRGLLGAPTLPAWRRYTGVVWDHLDPATLDVRARRRIVVVSGLHGLLRGDDPVPDYRLKMGASLPGLGKLSTWWRPEVSAALRRRSARSFVVDLLPNEHRAAIDDDVVRRPGRGVTVTLRDRDGGSGGHGAKAAKGRLAQHLLTTGDHPIDALGRWRDPDFVIDAETW